MQQQQQVQQDQRRRQAAYEQIGRPRVEQASKMMKQEQMGQQEEAADSDGHQASSNAELLQTSESPPTAAAAAHRAGVQTTSCAGCRKPIRDKFIFSVIELHWHQDCVQCSDCSMKLNERCYTFEGKLYCKLDYWRRFGPKCFACGEPIGRSELVQRIRGNRVYHLKCFTCNCCHKQLRAGEQLHLVDEMRLVCKQDFGQLARTGAALGPAGSAGVLKAAPGQLRAGRQPYLGGPLAGGRENRATAAAAVNPKLEEAEGGHCNGAAAAALNDNHDNEVDEDAAAADEEADEEEEEEDDEEEEPGDEDELECEEADEQELEELELEREAGQVELDAFCRLDSNNLENEENRATTFGKPAPLSQLQAARCSKRKGRRRQRSQQAAAKRHQLLRSANGESILSGLPGQQLHLQPSRPAIQQQQQPGALQVGGQHKQAGSPSSVGRHGSSGSHKPTRVRTVLNEKQLALLRECYQHNPRPDALRKESLVEETGLSARVIRVWFQNKRCKDKKKSILYKQMQQNEKDGRHLSSLMRGVHLVASSPIQYDDHSTVSSTPGGLADQQQQQAQLAGDLSASPHYALVPRSPTSTANNNSNNPTATTTTTTTPSQPADIHTYQPAWKSLAEYAAAQQQQADRVNPHSPRYQQLLGQIHGFGAQEPPVQAGQQQQQLDPGERLQPTQASFSQQQQQQTQNAYPPPPAMLDHHAHHMLQPAPMGHLHQFPRHC